MTKIVHPLAGALAIITIATFWCSTALTELFASQAVVTSVKTAIPWGFLLLVPSLAAAGASGLALGRGRRAGLVVTKIKRMRVIAANGILVLIPSALFLASKAAAKEFDAAFYSVQGLELTAGAMNLTLLVLNMLDGFRMKGRFRRESRTGSRVARLSRVAVSANITAARNASAGASVFECGKPDGSELQR